ncbi:MAG: AraC family transcriptional regulator, partial [Dinghuibacter sp.]|nr:AraC family transcriptional regulator [Dinghuibacter sp.]
MISYYTIPPPAALAGMVRTYWVLEGCLPQGESYIHRTMADGGAELFFHYNGAFNELLPGGAVNRSVLSGISGPASTYNRFCINNSFGMFGVYLYPFALEQFFGIPAAALSNETQELAILPGHEGRLLEEQVMLAHNTTERVNRVNGFLMRKLEQNGYPNPQTAAIIKQLIHSGGNEPVKELAARYFLSERQFERRFTAASGFTPKLFARITRFQQAMQRYGNRALRLTDIAYECGYFDQSHFIHDFKQFSGYTPAVFFKGG